MLQASTHEHSPSYDVVIVGAGPAGLGTAVALTHMGVEDRFVILERHHVGASFDRWPAEMRFITPSFNSNAFGQLDLNAFGLRISPALTIGKEHPSGKEYAEFLRLFAQYFQLPVRNGCEVQDVVAESPNGFLLQTNLGPIRSRFIVWAAGEFQYPHRTPFPGAEWCRHNADVASWHDLTGEEFVIIGGYESGMDAAIHLVRQQKRVTVIDAKDVWNSQEQDPSVALSTYTRERVNEVLRTGRLRLIGNAQVARVSPERRGFSVHFQGGGTIVAAQPPILATGFAGSVSRIRHLFDWTNDKAQLTAEDESTRTPGLFLVGPAVWHDEVIFCFIYKFRQRFPVVARTVAERLGHDPRDAVAFYRSRGMYLDDLSCCQEACETC